MRYFTCRAVDGGAGVGQRAAGHGDLVVEFGRCFGRVERHFKLRALVFFHPHEGGVVLPAFVAEGHLAHQPVAGRGEAAGERAVIVGAMFCAGDFLAVDVQEQAR